MTRSVSTWRCKCGVRIKVVAEMDIVDDTTVVVKCPLCDEAQVISAERLVAVSTDSDDFKL
jgi:hypothetical protein